MLNDEKTLVQRPTDAMLPNKTKAAGDQYDFLFQH
jgi:hypothetical protein